MRQLLILLGFIFQFNFTAITLAQPEGPFEPDEHTRALWHMDYSEPDLDWDHFMFVEGEGYRFFTATIANDGGYYIAGERMGSRNILVVKYNADGELEWFQDYDDEPGGAAYDVKQHENGNVIVFGRTLGQGDMDAWLLITDEDGEQLSSWTYGDFDDNEEYESGYSVLLDEDGGYVLGGRGIHSGDIFILKVDDEGELVWRISIEREGLDYCRDIILCSDGNYALVGSRDSAGEGDAYVVKINREGEIIWEERYDEDGSRDAGKGIVEVDQGFIFTGITGGNPGGGDEWMVGIDENGQMNWSETFARGELYCPTLTDVGGIIATGQDASIIKTDLNGQVLWIRRFDENYWGRKVFINPDMSYTVFAPLHLFKTNPDIPVTVDYSIHSNHGELDGDAEPGDGIWNQALELPLDGGGFMSVSDDESLRLQQFTIEGWFLMDDEREHTGMIIAKGLGDEEDSYELYASSERGVIGFSLTTTEGEYSIEQETDPDDGDWHHLAGVYDDGWMRLFYDGEPSGEREIGEQILYGEVPLIIGSGTGNPGADLPFCGLIDEVRISSNARYGMVIESHNIILNEGWNIYSSYIDHEARDIPALFDDLVERGNLLLVKDHAGRFYSPEFEFNNIPFWDFHQGYLIKMAEADTLVVTGEPVDPETPIHLIGGWSMIAYFPEEEVEAPEAFRNIADALIIAKDGNGNFYYPEENFNNIPALRWGRGYQVKVRVEVELIWNTRD